MCKKDDCNFIATGRHDLDCMLEVDEHKNQPPDDHDIRREARLDDILRFAGMSDDLLYAQDRGMIRSMLKLAYESGYLHGQRDTASKAPVIIDKYSEK